MSDYINKNAILKELERSRKHHANNKRESELLYRCENIIRAQPTLSETEIIRKTAKRIIERLEEEKDYMEVYPCSGAKCPDEIEIVKLYKAKQIVKEEGGIE